MNKILRPLQRVLFIEAVYSKEIPAFCQPFRTRRRHPTAIWHPSLTWFIVGM